MRHPPRVMRHLLPGVAAVLAAGLLPVTVQAHAPDQPLPTDPLGLALAWQFDVPLVAGLGLATLAFLAAVRAVNRAHPSNRWPVRRTAAFILAIGALALALLSAIDALSDDLLTVHMVQHLLLVSVAAPLLAASGIGVLAMRVASADVRKGVLLPLLHSRVVSAVTHPVVGGLAFVVVLWGSHFTELYNLALVDEGVHAFEHFMYLGIAALFWWPLLSPDPLRWRLHPGVKLAALLIQIPPMSFLAVTVISAGRPLYPAYLGRPEQFGLDVLTDQQMAGSLMWVVNDFAFLIPAAFILVQLVRHEERETKRVDAQLDRARREAEARPQP